MIFQHSEWQTLGPALPVKCPMCRQTDLFVLRSYRVDYKLFAVLTLLPGGTKYSLHCQHCKYEIHVEGEDIEVARALTEKAKLLHSGEVSREDFVQFAESNRPCCVEALAVASRDRTCPDCGEDVPGTFVRCWNCSTDLDSPGEETTETGDDCPSPDPQDAAPSPFGGMRL